MADIENLNTLLKNLDAEARVRLDAGWPDEGIAAQAAAVRALMADNEELSERLSSRAADQLNQLGELIDLDVECDRLRIELEQARKDADRIAWLAANAKMVYGHRSDATYQLSELPDLIHSSREECLSDDLRLAIDSAMGKGDKG